MYKCNDCGRVFEEPEKISEEAFYDCVFDYSCGHYVYLCPYCESTDIDYQGEEDEL